jgi:hypothetical protein
MMPLLLTKVLCQGPLNIGTSVGPEGGGRKSARHLAEPLGRQPYQQMPHAETTQPP